LSAGLSDVILNDRIHIVQLTEIEKILLFALTGLCQTVFIPFVKVIAD